MLIRGETLSSTIPNLIGTGLRSAIDLVLPVYCLGCGVRGDILCPACVTALPRLELPYCNICADPGVSGVCDSCHRERHFSTTSLSGVRAPFLMEGLARDAVLSFKYRNCRVAAPMLAKLLADYLMKTTLPGNVLVPVPLHKKKLRERGYNQANLLAWELGKAVDMPVEHNLLVRTRNTPPQSRIGRGRLRRDNAAGAFASEQDAPGWSCILVDDVCTTGSTLGACAEALAAAGANSVWALTLARERMESPWGEE